MRFAHKLLAGVGAELRAIFGVVPLLRRPFWMAWALCFLLALVGLLPGAVAVFAQLLVLIGLGLAGLFSGVLAKRVRRRKWVEFPDGREVAPFLPQLITLLVGPAYFLAMLVLFARMAAVFPGLLPANGWLDALLLAMDNFLRTQIFFDAAECFHLRLDGRVEGVAGASLVFVSRFLMDLVFIKLAVQLFNAAYFRAQGLGRGEDKLFSVKREVAAGDVAAVKYLCQTVGDSLRDGVDTLRGYWELRQDLGTKGIVSCTRSGGSSSFRCGGWAGWPPRRRRDFFFTTGLGAFSGFAEGGREELEELLFRRACKSRTCACKAATLPSRSIIRASRARHPGQAGASMPLCYQDEVCAAAPFCCFFGF